MTPRETFLRAPARPRRLVAALALGAAFVTSSPAWAKPDFPGIVFDTLEVDCVPPCLICHTTPQPTDGLTATQPFVINVVAASGGGVTEATLGKALLTLKTQTCPNTDDLSCTGGMCTGPCDADGDGMPDIQELENARNPNNSSTLPCPQYGCFARVAPTPPRRTLDGTAALAALGVAVVLAGRWRRRSTR